MATKCLLVNFGLVVLTFVAFRLHATTVTAAFSFSSCRFPETSPTNIVCAVICGVREKVSVGKEQGANASGYITKSGKDEGIDRLGAVLAGNLIIELGVLTSVFPVLHRMQLGIHRNVCQQGPSLRYAS
jgi:hypothetical protein